MFAYKIVVQPTTLRVWYHAQVRLKFVVDLLNRNFVSSELETIIRGRYIKPYTHDVLSCNYNIIIIIQFDCLGSLEVTPRLFIGQSVWWPIFHLFRSERRNINDIRAYFERRKTRCVRRDVIFSDPGTRKSRQLLAVKIYDVYIYSVIYSRRRLVRTLHAILHNVRKKKKNKFRSDFRNSRIHYKKPVICTVKNGIEIWKKRKNDFGRGRVVFFFFLFRSPRRVVNVRTASPSVPIT